jgi:hypothetical protein
LNRTDRSSSRPIAAAVASLAAVFLVATATASARQAQEPDYEAIWAEGISFEAFLEAADQQAAAWRNNYQEATPDADAIERAAAIDGTGLRLLVVAEDWCSDSVDTIPNAARIAEAIGGLEMRIVDSGIGADVMAAHQTPDGRGATPTVVLLSADGELLGTWVERPAELQAWFMANRDGLGRRELMDQKHAWYVEDHGRSTVSELLDMIEGSHAPSR